ncbi:MAG: sulfatase [Verrucomicrobiales bacterium]|nr:sulfatase [Verrucomicrobiales bacterium]
MRIPHIIITLLILGGSFTQAAKRPNILWISAEDINAHLGCFGDPHAITPNLDSFAKESVRYTRTFTTAGVCAPCRSGIITGMYQTTLGTHHMRCQATLPDFVRPFPAHLHEVGYYCSNNSKQDYQFKTPKDVWDESNSKAHWRKRKDKNQPFFSVFNFTGCHESGIASEGKYKKVTADLKPSQRQDAKKLTTFPPYYPETPTAREDWKRNYELITAMDAWAGNLIQQLKDDGLYENTIIFFWTDHGVGLPRAKRWLYDSGTHIPLMVRIPKSLRVEGQGVEATVTDQLVSSIDFGPTVLNLLGLDIPRHVQGRPFLGANVPAERDYVYGARDRMDERYDIIRMVRDKRFKYIRNYEPLKTYYQYMNTPEKGATMGNLRRLHEAGKLQPAAERYFAPTKAVEEFYDTENDPHELKNLADHPKYARHLKRFRSAHLAWVRETKDLGLIAEPIIIEREKEIGNRYEILRRGDGDAVSRRVANTAVLASSGPFAKEDLIAALADPDSAVRYWAATGLGNIGKPNPSAKRKLKEALNDDSVVVQVAAARALARMGDTKSAIPVLTRALDKGAQWERLHAAIVLDEMDEQARPASKEMHAALKPRKGLYANGKYTVRVINRALNQLEGTSRSVR